jgi:membrane fusion protein (multidrug efflux system)
MHMITQLRTSVLAIALFGLASCSEAPEDTAAPEKPLPKAQVVVVERGNTAQTLLLPGRVRAYRTAEVRARVSGIVEQQRFIEGGDVHEGDTLFQLDDRTYRAAAEAAGAEVGFQTLQLERMQRLLSSQAVSQQEVDRIRAALRLAEAALAKANLDLENTKVPAPISGRIGRAYVTEGALVGEDDATLLAVIEQIDPIAVQFTQPQRISLDPTSITSPPTLELDNQTYPHAGKLLLQELRVNPTTGTQTLKAEFPNPERRLLPGQYVRVAIHRDTGEKVRLPQRAVLTSADGMHVLVVENGTLKQKAIEVSLMLDEDFVVESGLQGGESVVVTGLQKLQPGMQVEAVAATTP